MVQGLGFRCPEPERRRRSTLSESLHVYLDDDDCCLLFFQKQTKHCSIYHTKLQPSGGRKKKIHIPYGDMINVGCAFVTLA
jgi:hypothetical protein